MRKIKKIKYIITAIVLFTIFLAFTYLVKKDRLTQLDFNLTVKLQDKIPTFANNIFLVFSVLARAEVLGILLLILLLSRRKAYEFGIVILFVLGHFIEYLGKKYLHQPTPPFLFFKAANLPLFRDYIKPGFSYPSGHAFRTVFLGVILSYLIFYSNKIPNTTKFLYYAIIVSFILGVGLSKVALGQHWPTDIVGGALLGASLGSLSIALLK